MIVGFVGLGKWLSTCPGVAIASLALPALLAASGAVRYGAVRCGTTRPAPSSSLPIRPIPCHAFHANEANNAGGAKVAEIQRGGRWPESCGLCVRGVCPLDSITPILQIFEKNNCGSGKNSFFHFPRNPCPAIQSRNNSPLSNYNPVKMPPIPGMAIWPLRLP